MDVALAGLSALFWLGALLQPWFSWLQRETLEREAPVPPDPYNLEDVTVVIPARNEAAIIGLTLAALAGQGEGLRVILVDDRSDDATAGVARRVPGLNLTIVPGAPLPEGWAGKLWALDQGVRCVQTPLTLLLDADIGLAPGVIASLKHLMTDGARNFVSVMAELHMQSFWERLLLPAFILYFKSLYPFALANGPTKRVAAAAGGCILLETRLFADIGGLQVMRGALIDDCTLASQVKARGARTWIGLSRRVTCVRPYRGLSEIWNMIARSAYTQLGYSPLILALLTLVMALLFWMPVIGLMIPNPSTRLLSLTAWLGMVAFHWPTWRFYGLSTLWPLLTPLIGTLYLSMTWSSALRYYRGVRSEWKGRTYR